MFKEFAEKRQIQDKIRADRAQRLAEEEEEEEREKAEAALLRQQPRPPSRGGAAKAPTGAAAIIPSFLRPSTASAPSKTNSRSRRK